MLERIKKSISDESLKRLRILSEGSPSTFIEEIEKNIVLTSADNAVITCASAQWCGSTPEAGLSGAVSIIFIEVAIRCHSRLFNSWNISPIKKTNLNSDSATALLVGDSLFPLSFENLARNCDRHAAFLINDAVTTLVGSDGILNEISIALHEMKENNISPVFLTGRKTTSGKLAQLAAVFGARLAHAEGSIIGEMSRVGLQIGRAIYLMKQAGKSSEVESLSLEEILVEASTLLRKAELSIGNGGNTDTIFNEIMEDIRKKLQDY